jgi:ferredoxin
MHERCCTKFDLCEFRKVSEYVTLKDNVSRYIFKDGPIVDTPLFTMDSNLCLGCTRCIRACKNIQGLGILGFTYCNDDIIVGTLGPSHKESGCVFCGACIGTCPTGALMDKGLPWKKKEKLNLSSVPLPPVTHYKLTEENIDRVPEANGVCQLMNEKGEVICIQGTDNMRKNLHESLRSVIKAHFFSYEEHAMYTMRENELVEKFLKKYGTLPEVNDEIDDLY